MSIILVEPGFQRYAWGDTTFIPRLFGLPATEQPYAEAWFGAHPDLPSTASVGGQKLPLDRLAAREGAAFLGQRVAQRFGELPYLAKILAAARPLSIQVHPSRSQAVAGFERDRAVEKTKRTFQDPNPKPELIVSLTGFEVLCGFRPTEELTAVLEGMPEIASLLPGWRGTSESLREIVGAYFALPDTRVFPALSRWLARLRERAPAPGTHEHWVLEADQLFSDPQRPDRGLFVIPLLNLLTLAPWQGLYLPAGVPHAYLRGTGVEVMASSDNVMRAGLTKKPVNASAFLSTVRFECGRATVLEPASNDDGEAAYTTSAEEFEVARLVLAPGGSLPSRTADGPELLLFLSEAPAATLRVSSAGATAELGSAGSCLLSAGASYQASSQQGGTVVRVAVPKPKPSAFRGHHPRPLTFGTSGLRGLVTDITDLEAYVCTRGFLDYVVEAGDARPGTPVALGGDLRPSTDGPDRSILKAVARAVRDSGFSAVYCGRLPTPALALFAMARRWPSAMVTGSHIPFDRNGIKFHKSDGEVLKSDEAAILRAIDRVRREEYTRPGNWSPFDDDGMFREGAGEVLPPQDLQAQEEYLRRYLDFFPAGACAGMKVVVYEHSAVGRDLVADVLRRLGAQVFPMGRTEEFVPIDTEAISQERLDELLKIARQATAQFGAIDAIVSTDGDSDRPLVVGVEKGGGVRFFGGDMLGILIADYLVADAIAVPVTATDAIDRHFIPRGVRPIRTRVGSPWVIAAMSEAPGARRVGWEANGGFLVFSAIERLGRVIAPLPTRDALLPILAVLHATREQKVTLDRLFDNLPQRPSRAGLLDAVPAGQSQALSERLGPGDPKIAVAEFSEARGRAFDAAGSELPLTPDLQALLVGVGEFVTRHFTRSHGFDAVTSIDFLDGTRITFANGDVAHVRASGNAPQLRIYAIADTEQRAAAIVAAGLTEPDGLLRSLLAHAGEPTR